MVGGMASLVVGHGPQVLVARGPRGSKNLWFWPALGYAHLDLRICLKESLLIVAERFTCLGHCVAGKHMERVKKRIACNFTWAWR